jgi:hypothetical protein
MRELKIDGGAVTDCAGRGVALVGVSIGLVVGAPAPLAVGWAGGIRRCCGARRPESELSALSDEELM